MLWPVTERQHSTRKLKFWIMGCTNHKQFRKQHQYIIKNSFWGSDDFIIFKPGVGKRIPIPGLEKMNPSPNPNPKILRIQSQSQNFQNSIPIPKNRPNPKQSQEILGIPIPKIYLWKTSLIGKKEKSFETWTKLLKTNLTFSFMAYFLFRYVYFLKITEVIFANNHSKFNHSKFNQV